jgi:hypothetical protein
MKVRELGVRVTQFRERQHLSITQLPNLLGIDAGECTGMEAMGTRSARRRSFGAAMNRVRS